MRTPAFLKNANAPTAAPAMRAPRARAQTATTNASMQTPLKYAKPAYCIAKNVRTAASATFARRRRAQPPITNASMQTPPKFAKMASWRQKYVRIWANRMHAIHHTTLPIAAKRALKSISKRSIPTAIRFPICTKEWETPTATESRIISIPTPTATAFPTCTKAARSPVLSTSAMHRIKKTKTIPPIAARRPSIPTATPSPIIWISTTTATRLQTISKFAANRSPGMPMTAHFGQLRRRKRNRNAGKTRRLRRRWRARLHVARRRRRYNPRCRRSLFL